MSKFKIPYKKNILSIDFESNRERKGKQDFKKSVIESVGTTLSSKILDYMKESGDVEHLTPDNVFRK